MTDDPKPRDGEVVPSNLENARLDDGLATNVLAVISNYTDRPDLLIAEIERHDPGFVKRMNEASERGAEQLRQGRFHFGRRQAYAALAVAMVAALAILVILGIAVWNGQGFWTIIALGVVYAITQSGTAGFGRLVEACASAVRKLTAQKDKSEE